MKVTNNSFQYDLSVGVEIDLIRYIMHYCESFIEIEWLYYNPKKHKVTQYENGKSKDSSTS